MTFEEEQFAIEITDQAGNDHQRWLGVVRFGLERLLQRPTLLVEIITREAERKNKRGTLAHRRVSDDAAEIFGELGLQITLAPPATTEKGSE